MSYYRTLQEDIERAKAILQKGAATGELKSFDDNVPPHIREVLLKSGGATLFGVDVYAAYKLLESFVEAIEAVDVKVAELAVRAQQKAAKR